MSILSLFVACFVVVVWGGGQPPSWCSLFVSLSLLLVLSLSSSLPLSLFLFSLLSLAFYFSPLFLLLSFFSSPSLSFYFRLSVSLPLFFSLLPLSLSLLLISVALSFSLCISQYVRGSGVRAASTTALLRLCKLEAATRLSTSPLPQFRTCTCTNSHFIVTGT